MKRFLNISLATLCGVAMLTSCCFKKLEKRAPEVTVTCAPEVLTLKGSKVEGSYTINVPEKFFVKKSVVKVIPVLTYEGGETESTPLYLQGEGVSDNYKVVAYKTASSVTSKVSFDYTPEMKRSTLVLRFEVSCGGDPFEPLTEEKTAAEGISTIQLLADNFAELAFCADNYKRITTESKEAHIMYDINSSVVRSQELNSEDIATLQQFIKDNEGAYRRTVSDVYAKAYASPDGPLKLNDKLSTKRGETTEKAVSAKFKKDETPASALQVDALGEDWDGFKTLVQESDIEQKDLILQILQMTNDPEKRDEEIKNLSAVFEVLAEKILPELRRSKLQVNVDIEGLSDQEMKDLVKSDINSLKLEELLYVATLFNDNATKAKIYKTATKNFSDCYRAWNNYGVVLAQDNNVNDAKSAFSKAAALNHSSNEVINNLGAVALFEGNMAEAKKYFSSISTPESKYNMGLVSLAEGDYNAAVKVLNGYNLAVAELCNDNVTRAKSILGSIETPEASYLKAIVAAKEGNKSEVFSNLTAAVKADKAYANEAAKEVEFLKFAEDSAFAAIVK